MDIFLVNTPLSIRFPDGTKKIMVEYFPHKEGLLFFEPFWSTAKDYVPVIVKGEIKGDGPWKVGECLVAVLACRGTDAELALEFADWQGYLQMYGQDYPEAEAVMTLARKYGASG
ncbi:MAG: hypothetical protein OEY35_06985 [Gammaproteobacteria bacterium]|nr:hypothetical protein [Gammaproteobacteria bacterium]MDH5614761.1 hypothetical protein [Gammaproteobacteria bacterium]